MNNGLTFAKLDQLLRSLGFAVTHVPTSHNLYEHTASGAALVLRLFDAEEMVGPGTLAVVRRTLIDNGLIDRARWDDLLRERSLAS
jgi:predicted RNA binding protein YcfA (HicA-like mRNA interferase family)